MLDSFFDKAGKYNMGCKIPKPDTVLKYLSALGISSVCGEITWYYSLLSKQALILFILATLFNLCRVDDSSVSQRCLGAACDGWEQQELLWYLFMSVRNRS